MKYSFEIVIKTICFMTINWPVKNAQMAKLVDAQVSDTCVERCGGSSPLLGTINTL